MSNEIQWYVQEGEQSLGPYSVSQMKEFAANGNINPESFVWAEGLDNWIQASQVEGLFAQVDVSAAAPSAQVAAPQQQAAAPNPQAPAPQQYTGQNPYAYGVTAAANIDPTTPYPQVAVKRTSFGKWLAMLISAIVLMTIMGGIAEFLDSGDTQIADIDTEEIGAQAAAPEDVSWTSLIILLSLFLGGMVFYILWIIFTYIILFRAWVCIQPGSLARTSPGKAIGFMFIPFFNIYWVFQAFKGLTTDWNRTVSSYDELQKAPRLSGGVALTFCIGLFFQPLGFIMLFPLMSQLCKGINFFASRNALGKTTGAVGTSAGGGGLRIGGGYTVR